eukprot:9090952-Prorocentrum_lima.AAC.1
MTSSLVGSEMCIRDSFLRSASMESTGEEANTVGVARGGCGSILLRKGPVSYTHLTLPTICSV